jgi:hypothetical protein
VSLPLRPTLVLVCAFGPLLAIGSAGLWELLGLHRRTATLDIGLVANLAAGVTVTLMLLAQLGLKAWLDAAFQAGNGLQLGLDVAWDVFLAIGTAMLAWNMGRHPRFGRAYAAIGLVLAIALIGLNLAAFPENLGRAGWIDVGPLVPDGTCGSRCGWRPRWVGPRTIAGHRQGTEPLHDHAAVGWGRVGRTGFHMRTALTARRDLNPDDEINLN